jgi:hypothetical protein
MRQRCTNPNVQRYRYYGGRGIKVCDRWINDPVAFIEWAYANGYRDGLSIDRIDVNGNYEPSNCRWATGKEQARNTSKNRLITHKGETLCEAEWAERAGITQRALQHRLRRCGWDWETAISRPAHRGLSPYKGSAAR